MKSTRSITAPLSPVLLAGMAVRPLPLAVLQPVLTLTLAAILRRHPRMFEALQQQLGSPSFLIDPIDLPFVFHLTTGPEKPTLRAARDQEDFVPTAEVRGPLLVLIDLMEGRIDGDAMFFSRELSISGDTEAVVALRNAVDGAGVNLMADLGASLGPLQRPVTAVLTTLAGLGQRMADDLEMVRAAAIAPSIRRAEALTARMNAIEERIANQQRQRVKVTVASHDP